MKVCKKRKIIKNAQAYLRPSSCCYVSGFKGWGDGWKRNQENLFQNYSMKWAGVLFGWEKVFLYYNLNYWVWQQSEKR